jgi:hypothetical protein
MNRHTLREIAAALVVVVLVGSPVLLASLRAQPPRAALPDLVALLKASPGVLGVDAARTASGKQVVFAWFENKQAMLTWYYSEPHQKLMQQFSRGRRRPEGPLTGIPDDGRPVMAIASLTMPAPPQDGDIKAATTQIAIELYAPLPGGLAAGGRFAPSTVKVPGLLEMPMASVSGDTK